MLRYFPSAGPADKSKVWIHAQLNEKRCECQTFKWHTINDYRVSGFDKVSKQALYALTVFNHAAAISTMYPNTFLWAHDVFPFVAANKSIDRSLEDMFGSSLKQKFLQRMDLAHQVNVFLHPDNEELDVQLLMDLASEVESVNFFLYRPITMLDDDSYADYELLGNTAVRHIKVRHFKALRQLAEKKKSVAKDLRKHVWLVD